jgi:hypothetical protein
VAGTQCALTSKNTTHAVAYCPLRQTEIVFRRARPLTLAELLLKTARRYRSQGLVSLSFVGPGGVEVDPEISLGLLYATPLSQALARDIAENGGGKPPLQTVPRRSAPIAAQQRDDNLWNASWYAGGPVSRTQWARDRFGACNASYRSGLFDTVKAISLCEPAPTGALQILCKAMLQYRTDIGNINCQVDDAPDSNWCIY